MTDRCAIGEREETLTRHHLIPRTRPYKKRNQREFERSVVRQVVGICRSCHGQIHQLLTKKQLECEFNTVAKLRAHPAMATFVKWIQTKPRGFKAEMPRSRTASARRID